MISGLADDSLSRRVGQGIRAVIVFAVAIQAFASGAQSEPAARTSKTVLVPPASVEMDSGTDPVKARLLAEQFISSIADEIEAAGFIAETPRDGPYDIATAERAGCGWLVDSDVAFHAGETACAMAVRDTDRGMVVASETFTAWGGPTIVGLMDAAAKRLAERLRDFGKLPSGSASGPLSGAIIFLSPDEGARVEVGRSSGIVADGKATIEAPPIPRGSSVPVTVSKRGRLTRRVEVRLDMGRPIALPALAPDGLLGLVAGLGSGHLPGLRLGAIFHIPGGWFFAPLDDYVEMSPRFGTNESPIVRDEIWIGAGVYLFLPPSSRFRAGIETKAGLLSTLPTGMDDFPRFFFDWALEPFAAFAEYAATSHWILRLELGGAYALGLGPTSILLAGWMTNKGPTLDASVEWRP